MYIQLKEKSGNWTVSKLHWLDLANGRIVHSLAYMLAKYQGVKIYFVNITECSYVRIVILV